MRLHIARMGWMPLGVDCGLSGTEEGPADAGEFHGLGEAIGVLPRPRIEAAAFHIDLRYG